MSYQESIMLYDPATGEHFPYPYPSHAGQYRIYHGSVAWLYNPWTGAKRDVRDIGSDCFGYAIDGRPKEMQQNTDFRVE